MAEENKVELKLAEEVKVPDAAGAAKDAQVAVAGAANEAAQKAQEAAADTAAQAEQAAQGAAQTAQETVTNAADEAAKTVQAAVSDGAAQAAGALQDIKNAAPSLNAQPASQVSEAQVPDAAQSAGDTINDINDQTLSDEEKKQVEDFSKQIDLTNSETVLSYGAAAQKKIAEFSDSALEGVKTKDLGEVGAMLTELVTELKGFSVDEKEKKGFFGFLKNKANGLTQLKAKYDTAEANVDKVVKVLEDNQNQLTKDSVMLDKMYDTNLTYFKELTMYILAGKKCLDEAQKTTLVELQEKAKQSGLAEDAQKANDYASMCDRFDKKLYDLQLSRTISMQMAPQIRLIQNGDMQMVEKIQTTINNTIPLWKNQMVLTLGMAHAESALKAQQEVNEVTNELIKKNAEKIKAGTVAIAEESEKGIVDLESVQYANQQLIDSLDAVIKTQEEGRQKRRDAEVELSKVEATLKAKLLDIRNNEIAKGQGEGAAAQTQAASAATAAEPGKIQLTL